MTCVHTAVHIMMGVGVELLHYIAVVQYAVHATFDQPCFLFAFCLLSCSLPLGRGRGREREFTKHVYHTDVMYSGKSTEKRSCPFLSFTAIN